MGIQGTSNIDSNMALEALIHAKARR